MLARLAFGPSIWTSFTSSNQRVQDALEDVDRAADLGVEHLSIYQLTIESQTPFGERERRVKSCWG